MSMATKPETMTIPTLEQALDEALGAVSEGMEALKPEFVRAERLKKVEHAGVVVMNSAATVRKLLREKTALEATMAELRTSATEAEANHASRLQAMEDEFALKANALADQHAAEERHLDVLR